MSIEFVFRLVGMVVFAIVGIQSIRFFQPNNAGESARLIIVLTLAGAGLGLLVAPYLTTRPFYFIQAKLKKVPATKLVAGVIGLALGLGVAALLIPSLSGLPDPFGSWLPVVVSIIFGYIGAATMVMRQRDIFGMMGPRFPANSSSLPGFGRKAIDDVVLLDTSVIIDGRIVDISKTGFVRNTMLVPNFVLNELQYIADSSDTLRRNRGRRGLEVLEQLQNEAVVPVQITDLDVDGVKGVDDKLVMLAKQLDCPIITNDFNLNSVAKLQGVIVLNINELANAVKTVYLPGEVVDIKIIQEGKERDQGVAYLDDGTMIVVENGKNYMNKTVSVLVTRVIQTNAGRMIFAKMDV
jgi:uncharacterized protein YacL